MGDEGVTWGKRVPGEGRGLEETMEINNKMSFIKDNFRRFCQHFMSTSR